MQERRRFVRNPTPVMVEFPNPATMKTERSFSMDVSETGMRFPTPVRLQVGQELPLTLSLPFYDAQLHATGEIQWVREIARIGPAQYEIGIRFQWADDPDRQRLAQHLNLLFPRRTF